jgi:hypothetical protein
MKPFKRITELQVQVRGERGLKRTKNGKKYWVVARCDDNPELVGTVTSSGTPARAQDIPEGSTFTTIFEVYG